MAFYTSSIDLAYYSRLRSIGLPRKEEKNPYLLLHIYGDGAIAPKGFNVKVFKNKKGRLKIVTTSKQTLDDILSMGVSREAPNDGTKQVPLTPKLRERMREE